MKPISEITAAVCDYGSFLSLAERLARDYKKVRYYSPFEFEYQDIKTSIIGVGLERVHRLDELLDPNIIEETDLFLFPDIGWGGLQRYLRSIGKLVWGSMGTSDLELYRTYFNETIKELGLPLVNSVKFTGVTALAEHLKAVENKWVKINRFRENMETWHHIDYLHSQRELERLASVFGPTKEHVVFVVQDAIEDAIEIGYDGFTVDGQFPAQSFSGYEKKNELYLGSLLKQEDLPEPVRMVNEAMQPMLEKAQYRNFIATELRVQGDKTYFIDPTMRLAGQTMEHQFESCTNLAEVILCGADGRIIEPDFSHEYAAEATIHYTAGAVDEWKTIQVPEAARRWTKLYHYCELDGAYHFPPYRNDEVGVIVGLGDSVAESVESLKENFKAFEKEPLSIRLEGFADLLKEIEKAEAEGMEFTDQPLPPPDTVLAPA
jgi:hypothetical protein